MIRERIFLYRLRSRGGSAGIRVIPVDPPELGSVEDSILAAPGAFGISGHPTEEGTDDQNPRVREPGK
jgi:hypothetical protein